MNTLEKIFVDDVDWCKNEIPTPAPFLTLLHLLRLQRCGTADEKKKDRK